MQAALPASMDARDRILFERIERLLQEVSRHTYMLPVTVPDTHLRDPLVVSVTQRPGAPPSYEVVAVFAPQVMVAVAKLDDLRALDEEYIGDLQLRLNVDHNRIELFFVVHSMTGAPPATVVRRKIVHTYRVHTLLPDDLHRGGGGPMPRAPYSQRMATAARGDEEGGGILARLGNMVGFL